MQTRAQPGISGGRFRHLSKHWQTDKAEKRETQSRINITKTLRACQHEAIMFVKTDEMQCLFSEAAQLL